MKQNLPPRLKTNVEVANMFCPCTRGKVFIATMSCNLPTSFIKRNQKSNLCPKNMEIYNQSEQFIDEYRAPTDSEGGEYAVTTWTSRAQYCSTSFSELQRLNATSPFFCLIADISLDLLD